MSRRTWRLFAVLILVTLLVSCSTPTPEERVVKETVIVEKEVEKVVTQVVKETVKETVIVEGTPQVVEKKVTKVVEKVVTPTPEPIVPQGQIIRSGNMDHLRMLNPLVIHFIDQVNLSWHISEGLAFFTPNAELIPALAESWEVSADGLIWTFNLRQGVKWNDGEDFTADDVVFTVNAALSEESFFRGKKQLVAVEGIEKVDDYTVTFNLKQPVATLPVALINLGIVPEHYFATGRDPHADEEFGQFPVGTGPYMVTESDVEHLTIEPNPYYWGTPPKIAKVIFIPYTGDAMVGLKNGEIDLSSYNPDTMAPLLAQGFRLARGVKSSFHFAVLDQRHAFFKDRHTRQALSYAIDRDKIIEVETLGLGVSAATSVSPGYGPYYNPEIKSLPYDPDQAAALLDTVGWRDEDGDGVREAHGVEGVDDGTQLSFLIHHQPSDWQTTRAQLLQQMWKQVGVEADLKTYERAQVFDVLSGDYQCTIEGIGGWTMDAIADSMAIYHCTDKTVKEGSWNIAAYCNPELDALMEEGMATSDMEKRAEIAYKMQEILAKDAPFVFIFHPIQAAITHPRLRIDVAGDGMLSPLGTDLFMNLWELVE